ncbi:MAG: rhomboid family intramembrane serine protease [Candidatus Eisenbacteria bacterium]
MYYDRRPLSFFGQAPASVTQKLLIANVVVFLLQVLFLNRWLPYLGLVPAYAVGKGMVWQFVTYMFLHGGMLHILFNMLILWMFGSELETRWGSVGFLKYYFVTGIGAGITNCVFTYPSYVPTIGASGAIFGLLLAYGMAFPDRLVYLFFFLPIRAKYVAVILGVLELVFVASPGADGVARFAHLGGLLFGYVYLKKERMTYQMSKIWRRSTRQRKLRLIRSEEERQVREKERIDAILDKINREGIGSLTDEEREVLSRASDKRGLH